MKKAIYGYYTIDSIDRGNNINDGNLPKNLKLQLLENGNFKFIPKLKELKEYEGQWDISDNGEFSYFIFKYNNGKYQMRRDLSLEVESGNHTYTIYFSKEKK